MFLTTQLKLPSSSVPAIRSWCTLSSMTRDMSAEKVNSREVIYDEMLIRLIKELKHDGFIEIKETQEDDESTIFMYVNVLKWKKQSF